MAALALVLFGVERWAIVATPASVSGPGPASDVLVAAVARAMDQGAYPEALQMAELAARLYPDHDAARALRERVHKAWETERQLGLWEPPPAPAASPTPLDASPPPR